jgi:hypothetical protein
MSILGRSLPQSLNLTVGDIDKSAELAGAMVGHDVVINAAGYVTEGDRFTRLVKTLIQQTSNSLGVLGPSDNSPLQAMMQRKFHRKFNAPVGIQQYSHVRD